MAHWSESAVTNVGVAMLNEYMAGRRLTITAAYGGSGLVDEDKLVEQEDLLERKQTLNIVEVSDAPSGKTLTIQIYNKDLTEAYSLSQIGVYAKLDGVNEKEQLLFVTQDRNPVLVPPESEELFVFELYYNVGITNTGRFHVTINAAGVATLDRLRRELSALSGEIVSGDVSTPLEDASGEAICARNGTAIRAHRKSVPNSAAVPDELPPIVRSAITAAVDTSERRVEDRIMGAVMSGEVSSMLADRSGAALATKRGETITARQNAASRIEPAANNPAADIALLVQRMDKYEAMADDIMGAFMSGRISSTLANRSGAALATRRGETIAAHQRTADGAQHYNSQIAELFPLFERMTANHISTQ